MREEDWTHKLSIETARWLRDERVTQARLTDLPIGGPWLMLTTAEGDETALSMDGPSMPAEGWLAVAYQEIVFTPREWSLVRPSDSVLASLAKIDRASHG